MDLGRREFREVKLSDVDTSVNDEVKNGFDSIPFVVREAKMREEQWMSCWGVGGRGRDDAGDPRRIEGSGGERFERWVSEDIGDDGGSDLDVVDGVGSQLVVAVRGGSVGRWRAESAGLDDEVSES